MRGNEREAPSGQSLLTFYDGWERHNGLLVQAVQSLTDEQLRLRAAEHVRPIWFLAAHIIGCRAGWFHVFLGEGDETFARFSAWDVDDAPFRSAPELVEGLNATWNQIRDCLGRWTSTDLDTTFTLRRGEREESHTRQWVIWHVLEHDISHGGELFLTLGMHGLPAPDL